MHAFDKPDGVGVLGEFLALGLPALAEQLDGRDRALLGLEQHLERAPARLGPCGHQPRPRYSPDRVSTLIFSPVVMNSGTWISAPVSRVAGLLPPVERSPCRPGSV